jgi:hypothetical protein
MSAEDSAAFVPQKAQGHPSGQPSHRNIPQALNLALFNYAGTDTRHHYLDCCRSNKPVNGERVMRFYVTVMCRWRWQFADDFARSQLKGLACLH